MSVTLAGVMLQKVELAGTKFETGNLASGKFMEQVATLSATLTDNEAIKKIPVDTLANGIAAVGKDKISVYNAEYKDVDYSMTMAKSTPAGPAAGKSGPSLPGK